MLYRLRNKVHYCRQLKAFYSHFVWKHSHTYKDLWGYKFVQSFSLMVQIAIVKFCLQLLRKYQQIVRVRLLYSRKPSLRAYNVDNLLSYSYSIIKLVASYLPSPVVGLRQLKLFLIGDGESFHHAVGTEMISCCFDILNNLIKSLNICDWNCRLWSVVIHTELCYPMFEELCSYLFWIHIFK